MWIKTRRKNMFKFKIIINLQVVKINIMKFNRPSSNKNMYIKNTKYIHNNIINITKRC